MKLGIFGGGQLAMMAAQAAKTMGIETIVLDPSKDCPASSVASVIVANYDDLEACEKLCQMTDAVGYEFENIPGEIVSKLEKKYNIPQGYYPLYISQNRLREKNKALEMGLKTPKFSQVNSKEELINAINKIGLPAILKTTTGGYDGKGQYVIKDIKDIDEININREFILEEMIKFDLEISVIAVKGKDKVITFPIPRNIHKNGILHISVVPSGVKDSILEKAKNMAVDFMKDFYGIVAIEMFVKGDEVYFNEMAPRPHNSGHYTIEGCNVSQYTEFVKSVLGMPLTQPTLLQDTVMFNILGQDMANVDEMKKYKDSFLHMYNKVDVRVNRKMGHITLINCNYDDAMKFNDKFYR